MMWIVKVLQGVELLIRSMKFKVLEVSARMKVKSYGTREYSVAVYMSDSLLEKMMSWGSESAWPELEMLMTCLGSGSKVLDVACGVAPVYEMLAGMGLEYSGCDISEYYLGVAGERGVPKWRLSVVDINKMPYQDGEFDIAFSIGSMEHIPTDQLSNVVDEISRVSSGRSLHHIPVSKSGMDEGWVNLDQSYLCNSESWWLGLLKECGLRTRVLKSRWEGSLCYGRWFVCSR